MPSDQAASRLCESCRGIDFDSLVTHAQDDLTASDDSTADEEFEVRVVHSSECDLCAILAPNAYDGQGMALRSRDWFYYGPWTPSDVDGRFSGVTLNADYGFYDDVDGMNFYMPAQRLKVEHVPWEPRPIHQTPDFIAARAWLDQCQNHHGSRCNQSLPPRIYGMRLVDVVDSRIVRVEDLRSPHWVALSYVWGDAEQCQPIIMQDDSLPNDLPETIEDAMEVTQTLGYRYLWVDELCIDQEDHNHRTSQISKMDQIYKGADLTIVAACGDDKYYGLPGVGCTPRIEHPVVHLNQGMVFSIEPDPRDSVRDSTWFSRAWTLQEGYLSKRLLVFTDHQMMFICREQGWMEGLTGPPYADPTGANTGIWESLWASFSWRKVPYTGQHPDLYSFHGIITTYTKRKLTYATDALNAALGVLHHHGNREHPVYNFAGLPYFRGPSDSAPVFTVEEAIGTALSWCHLPCDYSDLKRRDMFPSWTWAGWTRGVGWGTIPAQICFLHKVGLETKVDGVLQLPEHHNAAAGPRLQRNLDSVAIIHFEAPTVPASYFEVEERVVKIHSEPISPLDMSWFPLNVQKEMVLKVREGLWSCFVLLAYDLSRTVEEPEKRALYKVLVCQWIDGDTAQRLSCLDVYRYGEKIEEFEAGLLEKRRVRLI